MMNFQPLFWAGLAIGAAVTGVVIAIINAILGVDSCG
jgi:hypothetical protein